MQTDGSGQARAGIPTMLETELLELFAPARIAPTTAPTTASSVARADHAALWRADAIHRAKNMAQMTMALATVAKHPSRELLPIDLVMQARRLSRAYDALGIDDECATPLPCATLLDEVATRLAGIFGRSRRIAVAVSADPVLLAPDIRRALVLVASELIINALKYGYPDGTGGRIAVTLAARAGAVELVVEDDGVGRIDDYAAGHGGGLLDQLCAVLGASVVRTPGGSGHGFRVAMLVPCADA